MKNTRILINSLAACGLALAMVSTLAAQTPEQGTAKVIRIKGAARYTTGNNVWLPLKAGAVVKPGTIIQTSYDEGSYVDLILGEGSGTALTPVSFNPSPSTSTPPLSYQPKADQNVVRLMANTKMGIDKLTCLQTGADVVSETQLDLQAGRVLGNVKKMSAASKFEVKLPNGVAGIRGTFFDLSVTGLCRVLAGSVVLATVGADGSVSTQVITSGYQFDPATGQLTPIPADVLKFLNRIIASWHLPPGVYRITFPGDHTINHVSQFTGQGQSAPQPTPTPE
jgi:hypothetical protein